MLFTTALLTLSLAPQPLPPQDAGNPHQVTTETGLNELSTKDGTIFHSTTFPVDSLRQVDFPRGGGFVMLWNETQEGQSVPHYNVFRSSTGFARVRQTDYELHMQRGTFDPVQGTPVSSLPGSGNLFLVQFICPPLEEFRTELSNLGATVKQFIPNHTRIVQMNAEVADAVGDLSFVRWVGPLHASYRLEQELLDGLDGESLAPQTHCYVQLYDKGPEPKALLATKIQTLGGEIVAQIPDGYRLEALLTPKQIAAVAELDDVLFIDRWSAPEEDLNNVRITSGANALETIAGFTGAGVRAEVCDGNVLASHVGFQHAPLLIHGPTSGSADHGTKTTGIVFGDGTANTLGRGILPDAQGIFADYSFLNNRYQHTSELLQAPYFALFQSNSWGGSLTSSYNSTSFEMDDILFDFDLIILQSQSNTGNTSSRPQAWAKNIISVGGIRHNNNTNLNDDNWSGAGSTGPAQDGRLKPDMSLWYDSILTTDDNSNTAYTTSFGGTSAATPLVAGHVGLIQEMWSAGIFGNTPTGTTVFERRAKATTARALLVNSALQYPFNGANHDLTRTHQGWGLPDVKHLHDVKDSMFIVNEETLLTDGTSVSYQVNVPAGLGELRATLVYLDPPGTTSAGQHRINDLSIKVTSPTNQVFWGNNGLRTGNWSTSGGTSNTKDVIENVYIENAVQGSWAVQIFADEINADSHVETGALDADFALVISGVTGATVCNLPSTYCSPKVTSLGTFPLIDSTGTTSVATNNFQVSVTGAMPNKTALYFTGPTPANTPFQGGFLCAGPPITRGPTLTTDGTGAASWNIDLSTKTPGTTEYYQIWFRDPNDSAGFGSGLSNAREVPYCD